VMLAEARGRLHIKVHQFADEIKVNDLMIE
jgi:hypothetical protein